jgi:hypothetical protein
MAICMPSVIGITKCSNEWGDSECGRFGDIVSIGDGRGMMGGMRECFGHPFTFTLVLESNQF